MIDDDQGAAGHLTLAEKINRLFATVHPPDRGPYSNAEVEQALRARGGATISANYLYLLRTGRKDNPTKRNLEALASFFGVDPAYFFDAEVGKATYADLELLAALRDNADVRQLALRAFDLSPEMRRWLVRTIEDMPSGEPRPRRHRHAAPPTEPSETDSSDDSP